MDLPNAKARYVRFAFNGGAVLTGNTTNKWMLDELTVFGNPTPEPATLGLFAMAIVGCATARWRRRR